MDWICEVDVADRLCQDGGGIEEPPNVHRSTASELEEYARNSRARDIRDTSSNTLGSCEAFGLQ